MVMRSQHVLLSMMGVVLIVIAVNTGISLMRQTDATVSYSGEQEGATLLAKEALLIEGRRARTQLAPSPPSSPAPTLLGPSQSPSRSPSPSPSSSAPLAATASRTSSRTCSPPLVQPKPPKAAWQNLPNGAIGDSEKPARRLVAELDLPALQFAPPPDRRAAREGGYEAKYAVTVQNLELLAPGVQVPVDACPDGIPCLRGDVVLLHQGRCGSHALMEPLGLHPVTEEEEARFPWGFSHYAEGFNFNSGFEWHKYTGDSRDEMLRDGLRQVTARMDEVREPDKLYFLSLKINQITRTGLTTHDFLTLLAAYGFRHLIIIYRNPIRVRASYLAAGALKTEGIKNPFHEWDEENVNCRPVEIPLSKIYKDFAVTERAYQESLEHPAFRNAISLQYERDLYDDPHPTAQRVLRELGLEVAPRRMELVKTTDCPLAEMVTDWEEVKKFVEGTPYEWALEPNGVQEPLPGSTEELLRMCRVKPTDTRPAYVRCARTIPVWRRKRVQQILNAEDNASAMKTGD